jgi:gag-polypeptide of LTR copia-type
MDGIRAVLFTQITTMKYATGTPIQTHQLKMEEVQQKLMAAGQRISDSEFLSYFLNSLPAELDQFTTTVNHTTDTVTSITTRLRQMELCCELHGEGSDEVGLLAKGKGKTGGGKGTNVK